MMPTDGAHAATYRKSPKFAIYMFLFLGFITFTLFGTGGDARFIAWVLVLLIVVIFADTFRYQVDLYSNVLVCRRLLGTTRIPLNAKTRYFYRGVSESINGIPAGQYLFIELEHDKHNVKLSPRLIGIEELRDQLIMAEVNYVLPAARAAYSSGRILDFGLVCVERGKIVGKKTTLPVANIARMVLESGRLTLFAKWQGAANAPDLGAYEAKPAFQLDVSKITNATTLFTILEEATRSRGAAQVV